MLNTIKSLAESIAQVNKLYLIPYAVFFIFLLIAAYLVVNYLAENMVFEKLIARVKADVEEQRRLREKEIKRKIMLEGETEQKSKLVKLDNLLLDAGIKNKNKDMTAELFLFMCAGIEIAAVFLLWIFSSNMFVTIGGMLIVAIFIYAYLEMKAIKNYTKIENETIKFINLLSNVSHSEPTIAEMLKRTIPLLSEPLRTHVEECYYDIKTSSDVPASLNRFANNVNHKKLKEIILSLKTCATHNENYAEVIKDNSDSVRQYIADRRKKRNNQKNALIEMVILGLAGIGMIAMLSTMIEDVNYIIFQTLPGQVILIYLAIIIVSGIIDTLKMGRR